jgi:hypothetical protein
VQVAGPVPGGIPASDEHETVPYGRALFRARIDERDVDLLDAIKVGRSRKTSSTA